MIPALEGKARVSGFDLDFRGGRAGYSSSGTG